MTDYDLIAPFYDIEHAHFDEDVSLYLNFAELSGGPLLELACGSGRLLVPLAREGYELTGVDSSKSMLNLAQHALDEAGVAEQCTLIQENMCTMQPGTEIPHGVYCAWLIWTCMYAPGTTASACRGT